MKSEFWQEIIGNVYTQRRSNTRFVYVIILILVALIILSCCTAIILESIKTEKIALDYFSGISDVIYAVAILIICAGIPKVASDEVQRRHFKKEDNKK
jgi:hypothetical protein